MTANLRDLWLELSQQPSREPSRASLKLVDSRDHVRVFASTTDLERRPGLLIELPAAVRPRTFNPLITRAFEASTPDITGLPVGRWALVIELKDRTFLDLFTTLANEVVSSALESVNSEEALRSVRRCVERWRRFIERRSTPLTDEEVCGLIGELIVLGRCARRFGPEAAIDAWRGPSGGLRDFELADVSVEVKSFQGDSGATVQIAPPDQLDAVAERPVLLCAVRLARTESQGSPLADFVRLVALVLGQAAEARDAFDDRLAAVGYLPAHADLYPSRFVAGPVRLFAVRQDFPRIRPGDIPAGVLDVRFSVSLASLQPFVVDAAAVIGDRLPELELVES